MALLTTWGDFNKVESKKLNQTYTAEWHPARKYRTNPYYELHRVTTKEYSFVGMNEATAVACANAKREQLTYVWTVEASTSAGVARSRVKRIAGSVNVEPMEGGMWRVVISINADDVIWKDASNVNIDAIPSYFPPFVDTDESTPGGGSLYAKNIEVDGDGNVFLNYAAYVAGFSHLSNEFKVQASDSGSVWVEFTPVAKEANRVKLYSSIPASSPTYLRLSWCSSVHSNTIATPELVLPTVSIANLRWEDSTYVTVANDWFLNLTASFSFEDARMAIEWTDQKAEGGVYDGWTNSTTWQRVGSGFTNASFKLGDTNRHRSLRAYRVAVVTGESTKVYSNVLRTPFDQLDAKYAGDWTGVTLATCDWTYDPVTSTEYATASLGLTVDPGVVIDPTKTTYFAERWDPLNETWVAIETIYKDANSLSVKTTTTKPLAIRVRYEGHATSPREPQDMSPTAE